MTKNKLELTQTLINHLPDGNNIELNWALTHWWVNIRNSGGLRLTDIGFQAFKHLDIENYSLQIDPAKFDRRTILMLDRKMQSPYYIEFKKHLPQRLIMFNSKEAMLALLYGDLDLFLKNY